MNLRLLSCALLVVCLAILAAACGSDSAYRASPSATKSASTRTSIAASPTFGVQTPTGGPTSGAVVTTPDPDGPVSSSDTPQARTPIPTLAANMKLEPAPIDDAEIIVRESFPPQYAVRIVAGLPSGCHKYAGATVSRNGVEIMIDVENQRPSDGTIACTAIYGTHEETIELGSDFVAGTAYRVHVNERVLEFTAQ